MSTLWEWLSWPGCVLRTSSQVGACIVSEDNKILSMGYNGFPIGCSDDDFPWAREGEELETKYLYVTHSELNAILNYRGGSLEGAKLYVTLFPCNECAKAIIQSGIKTIVYGNDKYANTPAVIARRECWTRLGLVLSVQSYGKRDYNTALIVTIQSCGDRSCAAANPSCFG